MRAGIATAVLALAAVVAGCAGGVAGPAAPATSVPPVPPAPLPVDFAADCARIGRLAAAGDHKPAVDDFAALVAAGAGCDAAVLARIEDSRGVLDEADALVRRGLESRREGDLAAARQSFELALAVYPRYHWVGQLLANLPAEPVPSAEVRRRVAELRAAGRLREALDLLRAEAAPSAGDPGLAAEVEALRAELADQSLTVARRHKRAGDLAAAVEWTRGAIAAEPGDSARRRVIDFARRLGLDCFAAGELVQAQSIWREALALDESNEVLLQYLEEVTVRLENLESIKATGDG